MATKAELDAGCKAGHDWALAIVRHFAPPGFIEREAEAKLESNPGLVREGVAKILQAAELARAASMGAEPGGIVGDPLLKGGPKPPSGAQV